MGRRTQNKMAQIHLHKNEEYEVWSRALSFFKVI